MPALLLHNALRTDGNGRGVALASMPTSRPTGPERVPKSCNSFCNSVPKFGMKSEVLREFWMLEELVLTAFMLLSMTAATVYP